MTDSPAERARDREKQRKELPASAVSDAFLTRKDTEPDELAAVSDGRCEQCVVLMINGVRCHEIGCPIAWRDYDRECRWCGQSFRPAAQHQRACDDACQEALVT